MTVDQIRCGLVPPAGATPVVDRRGETESTLSTICACTYMQKPSWVGTWFGTGYSDFECLSLTAINQQLTRAAVFPTGGLPHWAKPPRVCDEPIFSSPNKPHNKSVAWSASYMYDGNLLTELTSMSAMVKDSALYPARISSKPPLVECRRRNGHPSWIPGICLAMARLSDISLSRAPSRMKQPVQPETLCGTTTLPLGLSYLVVGTTTTSRFCLRRSCCLSCQQFALRSWLLSAFVPSF